MSLAIKKIGGSLLKSDKDFKKIAAYLVEAYQKSPRMVVVVSALQGETDQLIAEAGKITPRPCHARELLLALGEQKSCALLGLALEALKIPYTIFCGLSMHVVKNLNGEYGINEDIYAAALNKGIIIVSGFHVFNERSELVNLGRGGSNFTALLLSYLLKADSCELLKDVPGVFNTCPEWGPVGKFFETVSWDQMLKLADQGVPVVQKEALIFAKQHKVAFQVSDLSGKGTRIQ